jgi:hypothetical protein
MAHPWIFESNFEQGTNAEWDSESDTDVTLDFPHYSTLAGLTGHGPAAPFRGAYCMRVSLAGGTNDNTLVEGDIDIADTATAWSSFNFYISPNFVATATDIFNIYELQGTADAVENAVGFQITAATGAVNIGVGKAAASVFGTIALTKGRWYHVDVRHVISSSSIGTVDVYLDGNPTAEASIASLDAADAAGILRGVFGVQNQLATTTGTLLFDCFRFDDLRVYPFKERYPHVVQLTKDGHIFVGPGWIDSAHLLSASGTLVLYDTDTANVLNAEAVVDIDSALDRSGFEGGAEFKRGCYADISTNTRAEVRLSTGATWKGQYGPKAHFSPGAVRAYGQRRRAREQNV